MTTLRKLIELKLIEADLGFKEIAGAADLSAIVEGRTAYPACHLFRQHRNGKGNDMANIVRQEVKEGVTLVVVTKNVRDKRGGDSSDENETYCQKIQDALLGWTPDERFNALEYGGGGLVNFKNSLFVWQETYETTTQIRS